MTIPAIGIDTQLMHGTPTGIGEYLHGLLPALRAQSVTFDMLSKPDFDPWRFDRRVIWDQYILPRRALPYPLLHCTSGIMPFLRLDRATIVTVHDVAWLRVQQHARWYARAYFGGIMLRAYRRATAIITVSAFSRDELLSFGGFDPDKVHVVYPGVSADFTNIVRRMERPAHEAPIILSVGTVERRKNLALIIRALARMQHGRAQLYSCGPPTPYLEQCRALAQELGVSDRVHFLGYIDRAELLALYAKATVAVMPSVYEGFGLGAAQALVAGVPLIVANASSLPEITDGDARIVEASDVEAWAHELDEVIAQPHVANASAQSVRMRSRERFSWTQTATATAALYRSVLTNLI